MKKTKKIIIFIQRSNGDVFLSSSLVKALYENYESPQIDLLVNDDTYSVAKLIPYIRNVLTFSYKEKENNRWNQEKGIISSIFRKYDLSINLTASDRGVFYALLSGKKTISAVEKQPFKSWWKKLFLTNYYYFDTSKHILINNLSPLDYLGIKSNSIHYPIEASYKANINIEKKLKSRFIEEFLIFHPSAQYEYKIYPEYLRNELLSGLNKLDIPIIVTGSNNKIDKEVSSQIPFLENVFNFIGETSIEEYVALSQMSIGYIGMDTLNMHIAASQNKKIFAIFGPTNVKMWSPWSNNIGTSARTNSTIQSYGNVTLFQANMACVSCNKAGCNGSGKSDCLENIDPKAVYDSVRKWLEEILPNRT